MSNNRILAHNHHTTPPVPLEVESNTGVPTVSRSQLMGGHTTCFKCKGLLAIHGYAQYHQTLTYATLLKCQILAMGSEKEGFCDRSIQHLALLSF